jgi:hypothetical protein
MQDKNLFEYAVIRVVPRVEREEFLNVGVVLYCPKQRFLQAVFQLDEIRLTAFSCKTDYEEIKENLEAFALICAGHEKAGPIGKLDPASRFRWLTATRSTVLQTSKVHPGFCNDAEETIHKLFRDLIL